MYKRILVRELIDEGLRLLGALDRAGFSVQAAFWVDLPESNYWRLVLASPEVEEYGPTAAYRKVQMALASLNPSALSLDDISVFSPSDQTYLALRDLAAGPGRLGTGPAHGRPANIVFEDALIYHLSP